MESIISIHFRKQLQIREKIKVDRLLMTVSGSPAASTGIAPKMCIRDRCLHLMFRPLDCVHRKEFDLAFLHHTQLLLHLSQFL